MSRSITKQTMREEPRPDQQTLTNQQEENQQFSLQRVSLDKAVAPLLRRPIAPFDRTERKRAHTSALFYSECFLHGIEPKVADTAAVQAQGVYDKWWVKSTASAPRLENIVKDESQSHKNHLKVEGATKKAKHTKPNTDTDLVENTTGNFVVSAEIVSLSSNNSLSHSQDEDKDDGSWTSKYGSVHTSTDMIPERHLISNFPLPSKKVNIEVIKQLLIEDLRLSGGNVDTPEFLKYQQILENHFIQSDLRDMDLNALEGNWLTISKPTFTECQGRNEKGENKYSLGRISFDMFKPTGLICSYQASFNHVQSIDPNNPGRPLHVPRKLMQDIKKGDCRLQTYE